MIKIAENCHNMKHLNIGYCRNINDLSIIKIVESFHDIVFLNISECPVSDSIMMKVAECCLYLK
jgi:hypothetical protein